MDEDWFAVPGWTMWNEGIPRIPYCPSRVRESFFENADKCLMTLPPGLHFVQAPFFGLLPPGYPTARWPSFFGGIFFLIAIWHLARQAIPNDWIVGTACAMLAISRPVLFTSVIARPDLLCALFGIVALIGMWNWHRSGSKRWLCLAGLACGLGALFHPFAIAYCLQVGAWTLLKSSPIQRKVTHLLLIGTFFAIGLSPWLPYIAMFPYEFKSQFFSNVLERSGPGLISRILWPWDSLRKHASLLWELNDPVQSVFLTVGCLTGTAFAILENRTEYKRLYTALAWSALYWTITTAGTHTTKWYAVYPMALIYPLAVDGWIGIFRGLGNMSRVLPRGEQIPLPAAALITAVFCCSVIPGAGLKSTWLYWSNWGNPSLHAPSFIRNVLKELPPEGSFMVDTNYVFDVYLSGRKTWICQDRDKYWGDQPMKMDYVLVGQVGLDGRWPEQYQAKFVRREGSRDLPQSCFLDVYQVESVP